jgi:GNAT superfamily N-acetyltransferase
MGRDRADLNGRLLDAVAASHRSWFAARGSLWVLVDGEAELSGLLRAEGVWSLRRDDALGVRLVARGFEWSWRPHWMGVELDSEPEETGDFEVIPAAPPFAKTLPYREEGPLPEGAIHLGVRLREKLVGQVIVLPGDDGVAGIYSMGVVPKVQGRGIGLALTRAALRAAWRSGCRAAVLNATPAGERLYARAGFRSLGWGQTWWRHAGGAEPSERQVALAEAIGFGDVDALEALAPTEAEASAPLPGGMPPLALAAVTGEAGSIEYLLTRFPALATLRFPPHGGNLLHLAVEHDRPETVAAALRHGVDPAARDETYGATPEGWAEYLGTQAWSASRTTSGPGNSPGLGDS